MGRGGGGDMCTGHLHPKSGGYNYTTTPPPGFTPVPLNKWTHHQTGRLSFLVSTAKLQKWGGGGGMFKDFPAQNHTLYLRIFLKKATYL